VLFETRKEIPKVLYGLIFERKEKGIDTRKGTMFLHRKEKIRGGEGKKATCY